MLFDCSALLALSEAMQHYCKTFGPLCILSLLKTAAWQHFPFLILIKCRPTRTIIWVIHSFKASFTQRIEGKWVFLTRIVQWNNFWFVLPGLLKSKIKKTLVPPLFSLSPQGANHPRALQAKSALIAEIFVKYLKFFQSVLITVTVVITKTFKNNSQWPTRNDLYHLGLRKKTDMIIILYMNYWGV